MGNSNRGDSGCLHWLPRRRGCCHLLLLLSSLLCSGQEQEQRRGVPENSGNTFSTSCCIPSTGSGSTAATHPAIRVLPTSWTTSTSSADSHAVFPSRSSSTISRVTPTTPRSL